MRVIEYRPLVFTLDALGDDQAAHTKVLMRGLEAALPLNLPMWVSSGTLLGLYRDGKFIPSDTDIDIGIRVDREVDRDQVIELMKPWRLCRQLTCGEESKVQQLSFMTEEDTIFDIYFYYPEGEFLINHNTCCILKKPAHLFNPLVGWHSPAGPVPAPNNLEGYCEMRYGKDLRTPACKKGIYGNDF